MYHPDFRKRYAIHPILHSDSSSCTALVDSRLDAGGGTGCGGGTGFGTGGGASLASLFFLSRSRVLLTSAASELDTAVAKITVFITVNVNSLQYFHANYCRKVDYYCASVI